MNLLFIQGGSRWKFDTEGNVYTDSNFNEQVWNRYRKYCDHLTVILRKEEKIYQPDEAKKRFNAFNIRKSSCIAIPDIYRPLKNVISLSKRNEIKKTIETEVKKADKVIIRSLGNIYTNTALRCARKYNKPYMVEVTGFAWESLWYHSLHGKFVAFPKELQYRYLMKDVDFALYVTNEALQKRYPARGKMLGCSDVELPEISEDILAKRLKKIDEHEGRWILGTAAFLDVGWKGQKYVIKALKHLRDQGFDNFEYEMIGAGTGNKLKKLITQLHMEDRIRILGAFPHEKVFDWLDHIDVYIQSSFMEGLCRSIVEAMSRGCPVIASNVGGNYELISQDCLVKKGNVRDLAKVLRVVNAKWLIKKSKENASKSLEFKKEKLDKKRNSFYKQFFEYKL